MPSAPLDFQTLFEKTPARCVVVTPSLMIAAATDGYLEATKTGKDIVGRPLFEVFPDNPADPSADGHANVKAHIELVFSARRPHTMPVQKYDIRRPAEEGGGFVERYWQLAGVPIFGADGAVDYVLHFAEDVTELVKGRLDQKAAHARAESARTNLHDFVMQAPAALCILRGPEHVFELANPGYLQLVGNRPLLGKTVREALPEIEGQGFYELLDGVFTTGEPFVGKEVPVELDRGQGKLERGIVNFVYQPLLEDGRISGIAVYASDVTELVEARNAARESEQRMRSLIDSMPELAWTARADGYIEFYNRRWFDYTGTTLEQMQGWGWKLVHAPDMLEAVTAAWQRSIDTGTPFEMEFPLRRADGAFRWFLTRIAPLRGDDGKVQRWLGTNTDIHDQREARRNTEALLAEVSEQARVMEEAVRDMRLAKNEAEEKVRQLESGRSAK